MTCSSLQLTGPRNGGYVGTTQLQLMQSSKFALEEAMEESVWLVPRMTWINLDDCEPSLQVEICKKKTSFKLTFLGSPWSVVVQRGHVILKYFNYMSCMYHCSVYFVSVCVLYLESKYMLDSYTRLNEPSSYACLSNL